MPIKNITRESQPRTTLGGFPQSIVNNAINQLPPQTLQPFVDDFTPDYRQPRAGAPTALSYAMRSPNAVYDANQPYVGSTYGGASAMGSMDGLLRKMEANIKLTEAAIMTAAEAGDEAALQKALSANETAMRKLEEMSLIATRMEKQKGDLARTIIGNF